MIARLVFAFLLLSICPRLLATNYADVLLEGFAEQTQALLAREAPLEKLLLAEDIYYLSHESAQQGEITRLIRDIYDSTQHQELRATLGYFLTQLYRQVSETEAVEALIREMGYIAEWEILGPIAPGNDVSPEGYATPASLTGLDREISPMVVRAYGKEDYWGSGLGQYGFFSANQAVFPNQLAGALFSTWFYAPKKGEFRLGLGWSNATKVWVNKTVIFESTEKQEPRPDQHALRFQVRKGWHRVTLYMESGSEQPNLGFFARMTNEAGQPVAVTAKRLDRVPRAKPKLRVETDTLLELAEAHSAYALASVLLIKEHKFHSRHGNPKDHLLEAFRDSASREVITKLNGLTSDANEQLQYIRTFLRKWGTDPAHGLDRAWANTRLGQLALDQSRFWEARNYADLAEKAYADYWPAQLLKSNTLSALGLHGEALRHTLALNQRHPGVPWILMDLGDLYWSLDFTRESDTYTDAVLALRLGNTKFAERKISILKGRGELEKLDAFYQKVVRDTPYSVPLLLNYTRFLIANEKFEKAESLLNKALGQLPDNPFILEGLGELYQTQGNPEALVYFRRSLDLRPQNPRLEKILELANSEEIAFYAPYLVEGPPEVTINEVTPVVINIDSKVRKLAPNGQSSLFHQLEYEILDDKAAQELPGYSFSYAPLRQNAEVLLAEIVRGDTIIPLTRYGRNRISDPAYRMYYDLVAFQIPFPNIQAGDKVRIQYRIDDVGRNNIYGDYFGDLQYFAQAYPIKRRAYTLIVPEERKIHYHVARMEPIFEETFQDGNHIYSWTYDRVDSFETESRMPGLESYLPYVAVSTFNDWEEMARWYHELIKSQLQLDAETKAIVKNLVEGVDNRLEIVKRVHEYVVTNTRYVALEFGIHGYKPYEVNQVCSRQFGDCKDKASLIVTMLREAGIDASIVITRTSDKGQIHPFPAMLSFFNHAIAYVPEFDIYLDGTAEFSGINELPEMDQGAMVLIVDKDGNGKLTTTPVYDNNRQDLSLSLKVNSDGETKIQGQLSYEGMLNPELRQYLAIETKLSRNVQEIMRGMVPGLDVLEAERSGQGINEPIKLEFTGVSDRLLTSSGDRLRLPLNILNQELVQAYAPNARRKFPIEMGPPNTKSIEMYVDAPAGYVVENLPDPLEIEDENLQVRFLFERAEPSRYRVQYELTFKKPRIEPDEYSAVRDLMREHDRVLDQTIDFIVR